MEQLRCAECEAESDESARCWRAYLVGGYEGEPVEVILVCPRCAEREFDAEPST